MTSVKSKCKAGDIRMTYSEAAINKAYSKYSFGFNLDGVACRAGYDPQKSKWYVNGPARGSELLDLAVQVDRAIHQSEPDLDLLDVRKFLCKHLRAMIKVEQELQRAPPSEHRYELLDSKPIDMNGMSIEDQCVLEVIQEQSEKANQVAIASGTADDVKFEITAEMVEAKMKEKMQQPK